MIDSKVIDKLMEFIMVDYTIEFIRADSFNVRRVNISKFRRYRDILSVVYWVKDDDMVYYDDSIFVEMLKYIPLSYREVRKEFLQWFKNKYEKEINEIRND